MAETKICMTIAGLDPSGGAGIAADIKAFTAFGCFAAAVVTSITFQNTAGVFGAVHQRAEAIRGQIEPVLRDYALAAIKTGMLPTAEVIETAARLIKASGVKNIVVDPVVRSTSGYDLIDASALKALIKEMFPIAALITPNIPEAERITRMKIENEKDLRQAAEIMRSMGAKNVLIKGGHLPSFAAGAVRGGRKKASDFLFLEDELQIFETDFIETSATHGTGCTLSSAIAANLAQGQTIAEAVEISKQFVYDGILNAPMIGKGNSPIGIDFTWQRGKTTVIRK
ncbi:MAG TPA: bifunctional hydroxymethylpyrimidine kinase/phosphomethylpyrimidine kinase [Blastocatellia bacterium]|nr:bifunctional hydroxymethylpyrimidine kinase/phosphomethylpyrimidine kinase [Blastocatellia bacterium]